MYTEKSGFNACFPQHWKCVYSRNSRILSQKQDWVQNVCHPTSAQKKARLQPCKYKNTQLIIHKTTFYNNFRKAFYRVHVQK